MRHKCAITHNHTVQSKFVTLNEGHNDSVAFTGIVVYTEVMDMEGEGWHHPQTRTQYLLEAECPSADVTRRRSEHNPNIVSSFFPQHKPFSLKVLS